jgi:hypothetical protein
MALREVSSPTAFDLSRIWWLQQPVMEAARDRRTSNEEGIMPMKRKISGMKAMDDAEYWLKECDGDRDDAVAKVRRYERGRLRQKTIIEAIDLLDARATRAIEERYGLATGPTH